MGLQGGRGRSTYDLRTFPTRRGIRFSRLLPKGVKMKLLIFDTETTGLPKSRTPAQQNSNNWPHIVSISWVILDSTTNTELKSRHYIIRPIGWAIPEQSVDIHGITEAIAYQKGVELYNVMLEFISEECDAWVAHNLDFDFNVIINAVLWDLKLQFPSIPQKKFCTMLLGKSICKLPGTYKNVYKPPKLKELYHHTFRKYPDELMLHNSLYDVRVLAEIIKNCSELRQAMGLETTNEIKADEPGTLRISLGDHDMEQ